MQTITTELDAVNIMLSAIGSDPVNSLTDSTDVDVINAQAILNKVSRSMQIKEWDFNTGSYTLHPNQWDKRILYDDNIMHFRPTSTDDVISKRGAYFYNVTQNTYEFEEDLVLEVVYCVDFDDLPTVFKDYIAFRASLDFMLRYVGDQQAQQALQMEVSDAYSSIVEYDLNMKDVNMLQLTNVSSVLQRS